MKPATAMAIRDLCDHLGNESMHTEHVATLALQLFDATRSWLNVPAADRIVLETAARLHDVGYTTDPVRHPEAGAAITLGQPLRGVRESQQRYAAAVLLFHAGDWKQMLDDDLVKRLPDPQRAIRLGAMLRVADGLDWGHIQDAAIADIRRNGHTITVMINAPWFAAGVDRANQKADMWNAVLPRPIRFVYAKPSEQQGIPPLVKPETHPLEAARRLMALQYKTILANVDGAMEGANIEHLHDMRVAIRRLRSLVRHFQKQLPKQLVGPIDKGLSRFGRDLGPARDADVWVDFLHQQNQELNLDHDSLWKPFIAHHEQRQTLQRAAVRRCLLGRSFLMLRRHMAQLLRVELPRLTRQPEPVALPIFAARHLRKTLKAALKKGCLRRRDDPASLHKLRIALRKARYLGEYFGDVLGPRAVKLTRRLKKTEQALGRIHDIDVAIAHLKHEGPPPPKKLVRSLKTERRRRRRDIDKAWKRLESAKFPKP